MPVNWTPFVEMRGGMIGRHLGRCIVTGKHRVTTYKDRGNFVDPRSCSAGVIKDCSYTNWLLNDDGKCRGDLAPSDYDYASAA